MRLSELFIGPGRSLVIYHLMYARRQTGPRPMWIDGFNAVAPHLAQTVAFAIAAAAHPPALRAHARKRLAQPAAAQLRGQQLKYDPRQRLSSTAEVSDRLLEPDANPESGRRHRTPPRGSAAVLRLEQRRERPRVEHDRH